MSTESNMPVDAGQQTAQTSQSSGQQQATPSTQPSQASGQPQVGQQPSYGTQPSQEQLVFGKYKNIDEAFNGYKSAETKIREQGTALNEVTKQLNEYKPMDSYAEDKWADKVKIWIEEKSLPEGLTYDAAIPEINMLIKGFEKAGVSEKQAKAILAGAVERQTGLIEERKVSIQKELGNAGMQKVADLQSFANGLSPEDQAAFSGLFAYPYVEAAQVDLMHRLLLGEGREKSIPTGASMALARTSADVKAEIDAMVKEHGSKISHNKELQTKEIGLWKEYQSLKNKGS